MRVSSQFNSVFILYISTAKPFSLVRGHIEVNINKHARNLVSFDLFLECLKYIKGVSNPYAAGTVIS